MRIGFPGTGTAGRHLRPEVDGPEHEVPPEPDMTGASIATVPVLIVFAIFQRFIIRGVALTGLKG